MYNYVAYYPKLSYEVELTKYMDYGTESVCHSHTVGGGGSGNKFGLKVNKRCSAFQCVVEVSLAGPTSLG